MAHAASGDKNRLAQETSPYLLLHQDNPVDWYPWGPEAIEKARQEDKPIFLSVGYSTCYWCHVMERESFSDPRIAALMNEHFVNIKVDREERPDLDEIYMTATQILTGHGGWPNSVFLTPELEPFYAGTYFPPEDRYGRPGFASLVTGLSEAWANRRDEVVQQAEEVAGAMRRYFEGRAQGADTPPDPSVARRSYESLAERYDAASGGFGSAPKFPTPSNLLLLLELAQQIPEAGEMLHHTLDQMARGGIYDQLGGGFHRYSTDGEWKVPHFEKMLYDNGFLLEIYAREHERTGDPEMARIARQTAGFLAREMTGDHGAFLSAIDAETDGKEGAFYVWTRDELEQVLGEEEATFLAPILGFEGPPFFEGSEYVLRMPHRLDEAASKRQMSREELLAEIEPLRQRLLAARGERQRPLTDDKVLADWNGIAITGMAVAGRLLEAPEMVERAARAARFVLEEMRPAGEDGEPTLLHAFRAGEAKLPAFLADYAFMIRGLLALHEATGEAEWLDAARTLADEQIERLRDPQGGFWSAADSADLIFRTKETFDGAMPAPNAVAALDLLALAEREDDPERARRWREEAAAVLRSAAGIATSYPDAVRTLTIAAHRYGEGQPAERAPGAAAELARKGEEVVTARGQLGEADPEGWHPFQLHLTVASGWHLNANPASEERLIPTELTAPAGEIRGLDYPAGERLEAAFADGAIAVYQGEVTLAGEIKPAAEGPPTLRLRYQPCDAERCLPPVERRIRLD